MKSEERHKLHQNALATWLAETITTIKPYQNIILGVVILLILAVIVVTLRTSESAASANRAWTQFFTALDEGNPASLEKVAEDNRSSHAASAADLVAADIELIQGCNLLFINKAAANQELNKAVDLYQKVRDQTASPALRAQAAFGLAQAREAQGQLDLAKQLYSEVKTDWPDTSFAKMSSQRLEDLNRPSIKEMYDKFAQYDPKPPISQQPGEKSNIDKLPEESPIALPGDLKERGVEEKQEQKADAKTGESKPDPNADKPSAP